VWRRCGLQLPAYHYVKGAMLLWTMRQGCLRRHTPHLQVKEILIEESNVQPVNAPVTVREVVSADPCAACLRVFGHG
jgi:hypothetical protein